MASRSVKPEDYDIVLACLQDGLSDLIQVGTKPIAKIMDAVKAARYLVYTNEHSYILDNNYLVCYQLGTPWFSQDKILGELTVARIGAGGKFSVVTDFLKAEAKRHGCRMAMVGTLLSNSDELLSRLYQRNGFTHSLVQLAVEV